jgi:hypothetical protein
LAFPVVVVGEGKLLLGPLPDGGPDFSYIDLVISDDPAMACNSFTDAGAPPPTHYLNVYINNYPQGFVPPGTYSAPAPADAGYSTEAYLETRFSDGGYELLSYRSVTVELTSSSETGIAGTVQVDFLLPDGGTFNSAQGDIFGTFEAPYCSGYDFSI